ncbi:hypothetical protein D9M69_603430 [compost metagenome]
MRANEIDVVDFLKSGVNHGVLLRVIPDVEFLPYPNDVESHVSCLGIPDCAHRVLTVIGDQILRRKTITAAPSQSCLKRQG